MTFCKNQLWQGKINYAFLWCGHWSPIWDYSWTSGSVQHSKKEMGQALRPVLLQTLQNAVPFYPKFSLNWNWRSYRRYLQPNWLKNYVFLKPNTPSCLPKSSSKCSPSIMLFWKLTSTNVNVGLNETMTTQWVTPQAGISARQIMQILPDAAIKNSPPLPLCLNENFSKCRSRLLLWEKAQFRGT